MQLTDVPVQPDFKRAAGVLRRLDPRESIFRGLVTMAALTVVLVLVLMIAELTRQAWPAIDKFGLKFLWSTEWNPRKERFGALPFIAGTLVTSLLALIVGTVIGVGLFDTYELTSCTLPAGFAPNGIELHPVLAICFGQGCDPLQGY